MTLNTAQKNAIARYLTESDLEALAQIDSDTLNYMGPMIQLSGVCNLKCTMCGGAQDLVPGKFMEFSLFQTICERLKADQIPSMIIAGAYGEPFLHPRIFDILTYAKDQGFNVVISTHGNNLNEEKIRKLVALDILHIQFSFCGYDAETYERIYKGGKFEKATANIHYVCEALQAHPNSSFMVNGVCDRNDPSMAKRTRQLLASLGVKPEEMRIVLPHNYAGQASFDEMREYGDTKSFKELEGEHKHLSICKVLTKAPGILWDGRVSACGCLDYKGQLELGNIRFSSLKELRETPRFKEMIAAFRSGDVSKVTLCDTCDVPYGDSEARIM